MKIDRMMYIIITLLSQKYIKATDVATIFSVSTRTIYRDIDTLSLSGIPIYSQKGTNGGFYIDESYKLSSTLFSDDEKTLLHELATSLNSAYTTPSIEELTNKLHYLSNNKSQTPFFFDMSLWKTNQQVSKEIESAIDQSLVIAFEYTSYNNQLTHRKVEPINLVYKSHTWYVYGYCLLREEPRLFRLSRMRQLRLLTQRFNPGTHDRLSHTYLDSFFDSLTRPLTTETIKIEFDYSVKSKVYDLFSESEISECDTKLVVTKERIVDDWFVSTLLGFGHFANILSPESLRQQVKTIAQQIVSQYDIRVSQDSDKI